MIAETIRFLMTISLIMAIVFAVIADSVKCVIKSLTFTVGSVFYIVITVVVNSSKRGHMLRTNGALSPF